MYLRIDNVRLIYILILHLYRYNTDFFLNISTFIILKNYI